MALISPGVEIQVIDESTYAPTSVATIPYILLATASNKTDGTGRKIASGTLQANANKAYIITSQRELINTFGEPFFYKTSIGTPIHGYELNEYGLLAAFSVLGTTNRAYVQRVDIDLTALTPKLSRPKGLPVNGTYWLDTTSSAWGIFEWNLSAKAFVPVTPKVLTSTLDLTGGVPKTSIGTIGSYAVVASNTSNPVYYKNRANEWVLVGSDEWKRSWAAVQSTIANPTITVSHIIKINEIQVTTTTNTLAGLAANINSANITGVTAAVVAGKLELYCDSTAMSLNTDADGAINIVNVAGTLLADIGIAETAYYGLALQQSPHTQVPEFKPTSASPKATGSVWVKTSAVNYGMNIVVKRFNSATETFDQKSVFVYANDATANKTLDPAGGGRNITVGTLYAAYDVNSDATATLKLYQRIVSGETIVTGDTPNPVFTLNNTFTVSVSEKNSSTMTAPVTATLAGTTAADFVQALLGLGISNITADVTSAGNIRIAHTNGGIIELTEVIGTPVQNAGFTAALGNVREVVAGTPTALIISNWVQFVYTADELSPSLDPVNNTYWYYSAADEIDIMINDGFNWKGYKNVTNDARGYDLSLTEPTGPFVSASAPTVHSDNSPLKDGDLWINSGDLENYPKISRWEVVNGQYTWNLLDNSDQTTQEGIVFGDFRWAVSGDIDPISDNKSTIVELQHSDYLDIDAPDAQLYPKGMLAFNLRRSGFNVKQFKNNYFNAIDFADYTLPNVKKTWVTVSGLKDDGSPYMGRQAVRSIVVAAMQEGIDTNTDIREEGRPFNLLVAPGYPELMDNLVKLNNDRKQTGFVIADSPMRLSDSANDITTWATNNDGLGVSTGDGLVTNDPYMGVFWPSGQTNDLKGNTVAVPPSHMILRTIVRSDKLAFPWFAPAGSRRGLIDNATQLGYVDAVTGEFQKIGVREALRDVLYDKNVNPITFIPGTGLVNYGNKTTISNSALDRINVARLIAYIRTRLEVLSRPFLFEPNDKLTRDEVKHTVESLMHDLIAKRGIYDYLVVCDESNNTPARIDRNELYIDIAIEPVKAIEFIYIPLRIKNTGEIGGTAG
jgi:hypothetical protein